MEKKSLRWNSVSLNPNSPEALNFRIKKLTESRSLSLIQDRLSYLCMLASGKDVLDVGVVEHFYSSSKSDEWLHGRLKNSAKTILGIDILHKDIGRLSDKGFNVIVCDITKEALDQKFDIIIIGDVIEHINSPNSLFENSIKMLRPGGKIVITTPNPWYANVVLKNIFNGVPFTDSADHAMWFDPSTICELASRSGLSLMKYSGVLAKKSSTIRSKIFVSAAPLLSKLGIRREFFAKTMIYEFVAPLSETNLSRE
jgi:2-polyprenyl-3-methyl-5-hydroxy-6-metoxy-1,4-benzoquinol methylase